MIKTKRQPRKRATTPPAPKVKKATPAVPSTETLSKQLIAGKKAYDDATTFQRDMEVPFLSFLEMRYASTAASAPCLVDTRAHLIHDARSLDDNGAEAWANFVVQAIDGALAHGARPRMLLRAIMARQRELRAEQISQKHAEASTRTARASRVRKKHVEAQEAAR